MVTSVSKMYKHRGNHYHRNKTKKYWHIIGYEYDDYAEERISEDELLGAIQFLVQQGIIEV